MYDNHAWHCELFLVIGSPFRGHKATDGDSGIDGLLPWLAIFHALRLYRANVAR